MIERIVIEAETPGDSRTMFRVRMDELVLGENLTAAQAHLIVGEVLDRITLPRPAKKHSEHHRLAPAKRLRGPAPAGSGTNCTGSAF